MYYFSSKSSRTSHLSHKNSDKRAKSSDKWSPVGHSAPSPPPISFSLITNFDGTVHIKLSMKFFFKCCSTLVRYIINDLKCTIQPALHSLFGKNIAQLRGLSLLEHSQCNKDEHYLEMTVIDATYLNRCLSKTIASLKIVNLSKGFRIL